MLTIPLLAAAATTLKTDDARQKTISPFMLTVQCAEQKSPNKMSVKDRYSAIQALDVIAEVAEEAQPAVVSLSAHQHSILPVAQQSQGSGFIVNDSGHVITNAHVVGYGNNIRLTLADGRTFPGRVLAIDVTSDLAVVKIEADLKTTSSLPYLPLAENSRSTRPGQFVLALGSPKTLANSVTVGVVSAVDRDLGHSEGLKFVQTDAAITFGNSGGPLVNLYGEVIGVNAMIAGSGIGFAIPVDQVRRFYQTAMHTIEGGGSSGLSRQPEDSSILSSRSRNGEKRPYLGLVMRTLTPELSAELSYSLGIPMDGATQGVLIHAVLQHSPAYRVGLMGGDIIVKINGQPIKSAQEVQAAAKNCNELSITVLRRGKQMTFNHLKIERV